MPQFRGAIRVLSIIAAAAFVLQHLAPGWMVELWALTPRHVLNDLWIWQLVTYPFLHASIWHLLFNLYALWIFGSQLEAQWGTREFIKYFFMTALGAAVCALLLEPHGITPTIGLSGAVFGLLVAFAMAYPDSIMYVSFIFPLKAWQAAAAFAVIEFFAGIEGGNDGIGRFAHLGGMVTGFVYLRYGWTLGRPWRWMANRWQQTKGRIPMRRREPVLHEVTDDVAAEVDRILEKILKKGVHSLTEDEKSIMDRYSRKKSRGNA